MPESNNVSLSIAEIYYRASWQLSNTYVDLKALYIAHNYTLPTSFSINMTGVPEGPRWLVVYAIAKGFSHESRHEIKGIYYTTYYVGYKITSSSVVRFTIDTTAPSILSLSVENKTYSTPDVPLTLTVNEPVSQVIYSLGGQRNVTAAGNTTLTDLPEGEHNLTVCVLDPAGNTGKSETIYFSVEVPFPRTIVVAPIASVAVVGVGLLVYFKKRRC